MPSASVRIAIAAKPGFLRITRRRVTRVGDECFEPEAAALFAAIFLHAFCGAELQRRLPARFFGRHSRGDICSGLLFDVEAKLFARVLFPFFA